ncbi:CTP synthase C-terminal region-related (seleno)protein [Atopomonas sediminilitoris]|uniref:CTP synthase C-terminal region-related (seleno)protein n=1 Tax=Atopomonas sediminilitoris TaxID=2919919 RepID=UPI001F4EB744|nr:CTP synthase [Atopomonas sediminilitoris]MCJ8170600.1 CTP synthase [Atopomonas sediminilitoris]
MLHIGLIGDYNASVTAHQAIPTALTMAADSLGLMVSFEWVPTLLINDEERLKRFHGLWCVPGSPYDNTEGALLAIHHARLHKVPFLGTCGGFQHALLEYARHHLGWADVEHAELNPKGRQLLISPLSCELVNVSDEIHLVAGTHLAHAYGQLECHESYQCRYGLNPAMQEQLLQPPLRIAAVDQHGEVRGIELQEHPFFVATLFQPERAALKGIVPPIVKGFLTACAKKLGASPSTARTA